MHPAKQLLCLTSHHLQLSRRDLLDQLLHLRLSCGLFLFWRAQVSAIDGFWIEPKFEFEPIEDEQHCEGELEEAEDKPDESDGDIRVELCLLVLDDDVVEVDDVRADEDRERGCHFEAVLHVLLSYLLYLLQVVAVLYLLLHAVCVAQQRHYFFTVRAAGHLGHDVVAQISSQAAENWVFGEVDELV